MDYIPLEDAIRADGLRMVMVAGFPSPWGHAAKAMMEYKGLDFIKAPQEAGGDNAELVAWSGTNSGPVVAYNDEPPINRWDDILFLLERLAPHRPLVPDNAAARRDVFGLSHEMCGQLGLGWNRRLEMFRPAMESGQAPEGVRNMCAKYGYNEADVALANQRMINTLNLLAETLKTQQTAGSDYFVGDGITAVDFYWAAFSNLVALMPSERCPVDAAARPMFENIHADVTAAIDPVLIAHRDRIMDAHFVIPMEL